MPIWIRYKVKKMNATTRRFSYSIEKKYDYFYSRTAQIRYSADKGMKKAKTLWCDNLWKGSFTIKNTMYNFEPEMKIPNRHGAILLGFREKEQTKVRWGMMMTYSAYTWLEFWKKWFGK